MPIVDVDKVVNGSPIKRITNAFNMMKENYNENTALDFYNVYKNEPLSAVIESANKILLEPRHGAEFLTGITSPMFCSFETTQDLYEKIHDYYELYKDQMSDTQGKVYTTEMQALEKTMSGEYNTSIYSSYIKENIDNNFENELSELLYEAREIKDENTNYGSKVKELFENSHPIVYFTYVPYASKCLYESQEDASDLVSMSFEYFDDLWNVPDKRFLFESILCCNKLKRDPVYMEAVSYIPKNERSVFEYFMKADLNEAIDTFLAKETVDPMEIVHVSSESAVNSLFDEIYSDKVLYRENAKTKAFNDSIKLSAYESVLDILHVEYMMAESVNDIAYGYGVLSENATLEEAYKEVTDICKSIDIPPITESGDDVSDSNISSMEGDVTGKKLLAPNVQDPKTTKLMDKEALKMAKQREKEQQGLKRKMRFKAVTSGPRNVQKRIEKTTNSFDEMDDARRKKYFTKPGFRKKWFRNLKLALLYGTAATYKFAMIPVVALCRHFSKKKDRRMRNELVRELDTEIKIAEEKINDANAAGDQKQKYACMRIKAQLEAERTRVATNSKYI